MAKISRKGRWRDVFRDFLLVVLLVCTFRWVVAEPFLVPSGSMIPTLLVKDYIFVSKFSYGVRVPFMKSWIVGPQIPKRGDIVVFRSKDDDFYFMVKRVVGLPGDTIKVSRATPHITINGEAIAEERLQSDDLDFESYIETFKGQDHLVQYGIGGYSAEGEFKVPEGHIFMMGDNRDRSSDSRAWGALPIENILGKAQFIWMSCDEDAPPGSILCLDEHMRRDRMFTWLF